MGERPLIFIDDDAEDIELFREVIDEMQVKHPVISFTDPVEALNFFKERSADALFILCDLNMPKINGLQLRKEMMQFDGYDPQTPFYLLSTGNVAANNDVTIGLNITDYLIKPTSYTGIREALSVIVLKTQNRTEG